MESTSGGDEAYGYFGQAIGCQGQNMERGKSLLHWSNFAPIVGCLITVTY